MKKSLFYLPISLAALLAAAGVQAQTTPPAGSSDLPPKPGEASTQTMGAPNAATTSMPSTGAPAAKPGDASIIAQGKPSANANMPHAMTRAEVVADLMGRPARFQAERSAMRKSGATYVIPVI